LERKGREARKASDPTGFLLRPLRALRSASSSGGADSSQARH
jgi:hypothetical protein